MKLEALTKRNSKRNPLCSPLKRERIVEAKCNLPGIPSILIPNE